MTDRASSVTWIRPAIHVTDDGGQKWIVERRLSPWRFLFQLRMLGGRRRFQRVDSEKLRRLKLEWEKFRSIRYNLTGWRKIVVVPLWAIAVPLVLTWAIFRIPIIVLAALVLSLVALVELALQAVAGLVLLSVRKVGVMRSRIDVIGGYVTHQEVADLRVVLVRGFDQATQLADAMVDTLRNGRDPTHSDHAISALVSQAGGRITTTRTVWLAQEKQDQESGDEVVSHIDAVD